MTETAAEDDRVGLDTLACARESTDETAGLDTVAGSADSTGASVGRAAGAARRRRVETNAVEWVIAALLGLLLLRFLWSLVRNENLLLGEVVDHLLDPDVLAGVWLTVRLTALVFVIAAALGLVLAEMSRSGNVALRAVAVAYVWVFGSIPVLVQLLLWSNLALVFPELTFGIPGVHVDAVRVVTPLLAAIVGLSLAMGAQAADAVGRRRPPAAELVERLGRVLVATLQATSLVSVVAITDLLGVVRALEERSHLVVPLLTTAAIWYLVLVAAARGGVRLVSLALQPVRGG